MALFANLVVEEGKATDRRIFTIDVTDDNVDEVKEQFRAIAANGTKAGRMSTIRLIHKAPNSTPLMDPALTFSNRDTFEDSQPCLEIVMLPALDGEQVVFPLMSPETDSTKQKDVKGAHLFFRRMSLVDQKIRNISESGLYDNLNWLSVVVSISGISKTMQMRDPLMTGIRLLGPQSNETTRREDVVLLRAGKYLYAYWFNNNTQKVEVSSCKCDDLKALKAVTDSLRHDMEAHSLKEPKLVLDMEEDERNPKLLVRTHTSMSAREVTDTFKSMSKGGGVIFLLTQPWCFEECHLAAIALESCGFDGMINMCTERFPVTAGRVRFLFQWTEDEVKEYRGQLMQPTSLKGWDNLPEGASAFIAPVLKAGVTSPKIGISEDGTWPLKFAFLGPLQAASVLNGTITTAKLQQLNDHMLNHEVHQMLVLMGLMRGEYLALYPRLPEPQQIHSWRWYKGSSDKSKRTKLTGAAVRKLLKSFPEVRGVRVLPHQHHVGSLVESVVYKSGAVNGLVYDFLLINHANKPMIITMVKVTTGDAKSHALPEGALNEVLDRLKVTNDSDIKLRYIFANPISSKHDMKSETHGQLFVKLVHKPMDMAKADAKENERQTQLDGAEMVRAAKESCIEAKKAFSDTTAQDAIMHAVDKLKQANDNFNEVEATATEQLEKIRQEGEDKIKAARTSDIVTWDEYLKMKEERPMERLLQEMDIFFVSFPFSFDIVEKQKR